MHFLRVIQITQYCVEIRHNTLVTFFIYLLHSFGKDIQRLIGLSFLMIGYSQIIIEFKRLRIVLQCRLRYPNDIIEIIVAYGITQQLKACRLVLRIEFQYLMQYRNSLFLHFLCQQILCTQHCQIGILLRTFQNVLKQRNNLRAILGALLRLKDKLTHNFHLGIRLHIIIQ